MIKVCMVTSIHPDFDARIFRMAKSIAKAGLKIDLICPWNVEEGENDGIYYRPIPKVARSQRYKLYSHIWKKLTSEAYDIYHFHDLDILPLFMLFKLITKAVVVYDMHENYVEEMKTKSYISPFIRPILARIVQLLEWTGLNIIGNLIVVEDNQESRYSDMNINIQKLRNFAALSFGEGRTDDYLNRADAVIFTGSQYVSNGTLLFLEIARLVYEKNPLIKFYCADRFGDPNLKGIVIDKIKEYGIQNITMLPNVQPNNLMSYLNMATIALSPNLNTPRQCKAIPTKLFEYMAAGLPIIASNLPYNKRFIESAECGVLVDPQRPDEFANAILMLSRNREEAKAMGLRGLKMFKEHYNWESESRLLLTFYGDLMEKRKRGKPC